MINKIKELIEKAEKLAHEQNYDDALEILEKLYRDNPQSVDIKHNLIKTLFAYGGYLNDEYTLQYDRAQEIFKRIIEIDPRNYRAHYNLGIANFNLENMEQAKQCYEEAIRLKPDYKHCFYNMGLVYEREGNLQEALKYYEIALEIDPDFPYAYNARNQILSDLDSLKKGREDFRKKQNIKLLKSLLEMSKRIKIEMIQTLLNIEKDRVIPLIIDWGKNYQFEINGDYLIINKETLPKLLENLKDMDI